MAAITEVGPGSFDSYEGIRILIPGAIVSAVAYLAAKTIAPAMQIDVTGDAIGWIVASLTTGLLLYFLDLPAKTAAYHEFQPTNYLEKQFPDVARGEVLTNYLLILNTVMPANTRNRALYIGSMYRIGFEIIVFGGAGAASVIACSQLNYGPTADYDRRIVAGSIGIVVVAYLVGLGLTSAARARRRKRARSSSSQTNRAARTPLIGYKWPRLTWVVGIVIVCVSAVVPSSTAPLVFVPGFSLSIGCWIWLYSFGVKEGGQQRRSLPEISAGMFGIPIILSLLLPRGAQSILSGAGASIGWSAAAGMVIILMMSGGHEGKLHGVYRGQTRWLTDHPDKYTKLFEGKKAG